MEKHDTITVTVKGYEMVVDLCYWSAIKGRRDGGLQIEPDEPAGFEVNGIKLADPADIFEIITEEVSITMDDVNEAVESYEARG